MANSKHKRSDCMKVISEDIKELKGEVAPAEKRVSRAEEKIQSTGEKGAEVVTPQKKMEVLGLIEEKRRRRSQKMIETRQRMPPEYRESFPEVLDSVQRRGQKPSITSPADAPSCNHGVQHEAL